MAGVSAAAELAPHMRVVVIEKEPHPAYHATGRSAAMFTETYGNALVRALTRGSRGSLRQPPDGFTDGPLLLPRGVMMVATDDLVDALRADFDRFGRLCPDLEWLDAAGARRHVPALRPGFAAAAFLEPGACEIDVAALLSGYLRQARRDGCKVVTDAALTDLTRQADAWRADTPRGSYSAPIVVNAAGAWADHVAALAGAPALRITPKRRTALVVAPPHGADIALWPLTFVVDESLYFKPDAGRLLVSPADETLSAPCDAQAEDIDVAIAVDRLTQALDIEVRRVERKWAGLRSFAPDKSPLAGFDPKAPGFFWLAGQGGYGIQMAPSLARVTASLIRDGVLPRDLIELGMTATDLSPKRLSN